jgi:hypothetical protein
MRKVHEAHSNAKGNHTEDTDGSIEIAPQASDHKSKANGGQSKHEDGS